jgi:hypothetical protein
LIESDAISSSGGEPESWIPVLVEVFVLEIYSFIGAACMVKFVGAHGVTHLPGPRHAALGVFRKSAR